MSRYLLFVSLVLSSLAVASGTAAAQAKTSPPKPANPAVLKAFNKVLATLPQSGAKYGQQTSLLNPFGVFGSPCPSDTLCGRLQ